jgi:PAS domain S-box-containing protein
MKNGKSSIYKAVRKLPLHEIYNNAPDAIILADTVTGQIVNVNKVARRMLGRTLKDLIGCNITELHPKEVRKEVGKIFQSLNMPEGRKSIRQPLETFILKSDGSKVPVEITAQLIKMDDIVVAQGIFRDISRRKKIENALRESEEKYRNLVERATDGIVIIVDGKIEYCNSSLYRMTGYKQTELKGRSFHNFLQDEEKSQLVERYQKRLQGFPVERIYETIIRKKNGEVLFAEINSDLISFEGKAGVLSIIRDVTVRKKSEQAINELNDQLHTLINAIPDLVYFKDRDGHNLLFNKAFESFVGKNARYICGKRDREFLSPELVKLCESSDREVFKNKKIQKFEENHSWMEDKRQRFFETIKSPIFDERNHLIGLVGISRDITDRKKAEEELHFRLESQNIISSISAKFARIKWPDIDKEVEFALYKVCDFLKIEFGSVFLFSDGSSTVRKKYEWIDPKIPRNGSDNNVWDTKRFREVMRKINHYETFFFSSVNDLPPSAHNEAKLAKELGLKFLLIEPLVSGEKKILGMLIFTNLLDSKIWKEEEKTLITIVGEMIVNLLERKRSEDALMTTQAILEAAIDQSPAGIIIADAPDVNIRVANPAALGIRGGSAENLTHIPVKYHPSRWKVYSQEGRLFKGEELPLSRAILEGIVSTDVEVIIQRESGEERWVSANAAPIRNSEGEIVAGIVVFPDITERKRTQKLLEILNSAAQAMQKALTREQIFKAVSGEFKRLNYHCMIFPYDEEKRQLKTTFLSFDKKAIQRVERLLGISHWDFSVPVEDIGIYGQIINDKKTIFIEDTESALRNFLRPRIKHYAGRIIRLLKVPHTIAAPLIVSGKVMGAISVQSDALKPEDIPAITAFAYQISEAWHRASLLTSLQQSMDELKQTQEQLVQAQKMEAVGKLAGGIAHDFNNLLTVIRGYSEILLSQMDKKDKAYGNILQIEKAGKSAESLIRQLLAFGRKQIMNPRIINLNNLLREMEPMLERLIGEDVELIILLGSDVGQVKVDPNQLEQVILNLVVNSKDAMPDGGTIIIETMNTDLSPNIRQELHSPVKPGPYVLLSVSDTGCGMDEDIRSRIFEPFFTTKVKGKGTGLGLSTVYGIINQSQGNISVKSRLDEGTIFNIYLPRIEEWRPVTGDKPDIHGRDTQGHETIVVVEDEKDVRFIIAETLRRKGYRVMEAINGETALEICKKNLGRIDLLLTDVVMPRMNGVQLARKVKSLWPELKVMYMSGYADEEIIQQNIVKDGVTFIQKPFVPAFLLQKVREVLDSK